MIIKKTGGCCSPKVLLFTPLLAAFFAAISYYYFQYSYSRFVKVDFDEWVLYTQDSLFVPHYKHYQFVFYSSNVEEQRQYIKHLMDSATEPVLALDIHQDRSLESKGDKVYATSGINTILLYLSHFKIVQLPAVVLVEKRKEEGNVFFQASLLKTISSGEMKLLSRQRDRI